MTHEEFKSLVEKSPVYKNLSVEMKKEILKSTGSERLSYEHIFQVEAEGIRAAKTQFVKQNEEVIREFNGTVRSVEKQGLQNQESEAKREEEANTNKLLKKLDEA